MIHRLTSLLLSQYRQNIKLLANTFFALIFISGLGACSHEPLLNPNLDESWNPPSTENYNQAVSKKTQRKQKYNGFYNQFDMSLTFLTENILVKQLKLEAHHLQWDAPKANKMLRSLEDSLSQQSKFFISVFTPKPDDSKLDIDSSGWVAMLYFEGERYNGHIKATSKSPQRLKELYPHHNIWSRGFILTFPIPAKELLGKNFEVRFTNPYGEAVFKY